MDRINLPLSSEQLEILFAFQCCNGLTDLSDSLGKHPTAISRSLQRLAQDHNLLVKEQGRWKLTPTALEINKKFSRFTAEIDNLMRIHQGEKLNFSPNTALVIVNAQKAFYETFWGKSSNHLAEHNLAQILNRWREHHLPVIHVRHQTFDQNCFFYDQCETADYIDSLRPSGNEKTFLKTMASAFAQTPLEEHLKSQNIKNLVIVGFTASECVDASAKHGHSLGFNVTVIADACATFTLEGRDGIRIDPEEVHNFSMASLNHKFAKVIDTVQVI